MFLKILAASFFLGACVTVNVNFPESAAQKATDDYVRDLYKARERGKSTPTPPAAGKQSSQNEFIFLDWSIGKTAWAAESAAPTEAALFSLNSDKARTIKSNQAGRIDKLVKYKAKGLIGETNAGKVKLMDTGKVAELERNLVNALVQAENKDRDALYEEAVRLNGLSSEGLRNVEKTFARSFQGMSPTGTPIQAPDGSWSHKP
ncbi:YdbL family protein [bacterium]|nr:YdbL family protein [bacterium]